MKHETSSSTPLLAWIILAALSLLWGSSYLLIKKGLLAFSSDQVALLRLSISGLAFFPFFLYRRKRIDWSKWKALLVVGLSGSAVPAFLFALAQTEITSSMAGLLSSLTPLFTLLFSVLLFSIPVQKARSWGILVGLLGAGLLIAFGEDAKLGGNIGYSLLAVAATACYALSGNTIKAYLQDMNVLTLSATTFTLIGMPATFFLLATDFIQTLQTVPQAWEAFGYIAILALLGTVFANYIFFRLVQITDPVFASTVSYLIPAIALGWGIIDGEPVTWLHIVGMTLILSGVYISRQR